MCEYTLFGDRHASGLYLLATYLLNLGRDRLYRGHEDCYGQSGISCADIEHLRYLREALFSGKSRLNQTSQQFYCTAI